MRASTPLFVLLACAAVSAPAQDVKVDKYRLPNGLTVILREDHSVPVATINIWFRVGSKDEPERRSGFAHLFEHLMFMGTKRVPNSQFDQIMEGAGGHNNAWTSQDVTSFFSFGPSNLLPTLLWLDADRMEALGKNMDQKKLDLQRDVVKNERRQSTEDSPYGKAFEEITSLMYPKGHPYHTGVIGTHEDLSAAQVQDVKDFFATYYVPNNASLVVAGDFKPTEVKPLISSLFGSIPRANDIVRKQVPPVNFRGVHRTTMVDKVQQPRTIMVWHSPASHKPGDIELNLAAAVMADGIGSWIYDDLVVEKKLATEVSAWQGSQVLGSLFTLTALPSEGVSLDKLEKAIDKSLKEFTKTGPTMNELKRQSAKMEFGLVSGLQSVQGIAEKLNEFEFVYGEPNSFKRALDEVRAVTPESIKTWTAKVLAPDNRLILRVIPATELPAQSARDTQPVLGSPKAFAPQLPSSFKLSNGIKVFYWNKPELPLMSVALQVSAGTASEPVGKLGVTSLATDLLGEGSGSRDAAHFTEALELLGARFGASASPETAAATLGVLSSKFEEALALFADAVLRPRFDKEDWTRVHRVTVAALEQKLEEVDYLADRIAMREYYGSANPAAWPREGTIQSVKGLSLNDVKSAYRSTWRADRASLFVAGGLPLVKVRKALEKQFGSWKAPTTPAAALPTYAPAKNDHVRVLVVDRPGSAQTAIRFVMPNVPYSSPDRNARASLGVVLGGTFTSRLNHNLREDKGFTYGTFANFSFNRAYGHLVSGADVQAQVTGAALKEFFAEFKKLAAGDVTDAEASKVALTRRTGTIDGLSSIDGILGAAMGLHAFGRPFAQLTSELDAIANLSASDLNAVAPKSIQLDKALIVLVGDKSVILPQLAGLGLPDPEIAKL